MLKWLLASLFDKDRLMAYSEKTRNLEQQNSAKRLKPFNVVTSFDNDFSISRRITLCKENIYSSTNNRNKFNTIRPMEYVLNHRCDLTEYSTVG